MNQKYLSLYLNLIQALLTCPDGEEWNVLHQHEELLTVEFLEFMEQVAQQLATNGKLEAAKFLQYWAEQLNHVLVTAKKSPHSENEIQIYLQLIQELLDCPEGKERDILAVNKDLVNSRFVNLMRQIAQQMSVRGETEAAIYLSNLAAEITQSLAREANIVKPKLDQDAKISHALNEDYIQRFPELSEVISNLKNNQNQTRVSAPTARQTIPSNPVVASSSPQLEMLKNKIVDEQLNTIMESLEVPPTSSANCLQENPTSEISWESRFSEQLHTITQSLDKLEQILTSHFQPPNPLWYMDILERAQASNWLLSSEEIEQLIGVKPKCEPGKDIFQRGCWIFTKVGKMGAQTAWKVSK
ncbi:hypothetical protein NIES4101_69040 [Calothrix sp. NIES-4101]|nr:hypothetical protein NIES4101_69040 [Calothrix sp. NIES-4101]